MRTPVHFCLAAALTLFCPIAQAAERVVEIATRPGQSVRALLDGPQKPAGSVILLAGGHGNLTLGAAGRIGWGKRNQLVRTRASYARAGFLTLVPDIAPDLKQGGGGKPRYRWSEAFARDVGALVAHLRGIAPPVYLVGTSRAALSVANAAVRLEGRERPDAIVITSGMLMHVAGHQPSVERNVHGLEKITQPVLLLFHAQDDCAFTQPSSAGPFRRLLTGAKVDVVTMKGGPPGSGGQCEAMSHHGFFGQDEKVVVTVTRWLRQQR